MNENTDINISKILTHSRLQLSDADKKILHEKLLELLEYIKQIEQIDTSAVNNQETTPEVLRQDIPKKHQIDIYLLSPYTEDNFFTIPRVI